MHWLTRLYFWLVINNGNIFQGDPGKLGETGDVGGIGKQVLRIVNLMTPYKWNEITQLMYHIDVYYE